MRVRARRRSWRPRRRRRSAPVPPNDRRGRASRSRSAPGRGHDGDGLARTDAGRSDHRLRVAERRQEERPQRPRAVGQAVDRTRAGAERPGRRLNADPLRGRADAASAGSCTETESKSGLRVSDSKTAGWSRGPGGACSTRKAPARNRQIRVADAATRPPLTRTLETSSMPSTGSGEAQVAGRTAGRDVPVEVEEEVVLDGALLRDGAEHRVREHDPAEVVVAGEPRRDHVDADRRAWPGRPVIALTRTFTNVPAGSYWTPRSPSRRRGRPPGERESSGRRCPRCRVVTTSLWTGVVMSDAAAATRSSFAARSNRGRRRTRRSARRRRRRCRCRARGRGRGRPRGRAAGRVGRSPARTSCRARRRTPRRHSSRRSGCRTNRRCPATRPRKCSFPTAS